MKRKPEIITREIQDLENVILSSKELSSQFPQDNILRLHISQLEARKKELIEELTQSLEYYGRHSIKYIFSDLEEKITLNTLIENLNSFKDLIDRTFEKVTSGKSNNIPIYFNTVFSGSYGIQLSTPFEEKLFDHDYEKAIGETITIIGNLLNSNKDQLSSVLQKDFGNDRSLLSKYAIFFKQIYRNNQEVKIEWNSPNTKRTNSTTIQPKQAKFLYEQFSTQQETEEEVEYLGILKGVSLIRFKVEFITNPESKEFITAKFSENQINKIIDSIDKLVVAKFNVISKYNDHSEKVVKKYELTSIHPKDY